MRREGFELAVGRPEVVIIENEAGEKQEPYENVTIDIEEQHQGPVMEQMGLRKGDLTNMIPDGKGRIRLEYTIPARGLIGFRTRFLTETRGAGIASSYAAGYEPWTGEIEYRTNGSLVADRAGSATPFAMINLQERGTFFVQPGAEVYEGMIVGENSRADDMDVNITKEKKLTNMRAASSDSFENLVPPRKLTLEESLEFAGEDECVEVTPEIVRIRKVILESNERVRQARRELFEANERAPYVCPIPQGVRPSPLAS